MATHEVQLSITAVDDADGLHGWIRCGGEPATGFTGWLGLIAGLDRLLSNPPTPGVDTPPTNPSHR